MSEPRQDVVINRALLVNAALDSAAIAVRSTVFHVFTESGDHDVKRDAKTPARVFKILRPRRLEDHGLFRLRMRQRQTFGMQQRTRDAELLPPTRL